jgi:GTPase
MLVDDIDLIVKAGDGGKGAATFRHDGQTAFGGPNGGNGGNGGDIYFQGSTDINDLREFRYKKKILAENGVDGSKFNGFGRNAEHKVIIVPIGTTITDLNTGRIIEIIEKDKKIVIAKGGVGGKGNVFFKSATNRTPTYAEKGGLGEERRVHLELRLIAEIGLIGLPNAGKSSLLSVLTNATPTIGDYPFTTLEPNIGMMGNHPVADIPGLIEGASSGKGLGVKFLRHIEKTKILVHCIDVTSVDPDISYQTIRKECQKYNSELLNKPEIIVITKTDESDPKSIAKMIQKLHIYGREIYQVSIYNDEEIKYIKKILNQLLNEVNSAH